jgi:hypothetical protein
VRCSTFNSYNRVLWRKPAQPVGVSRNEAATSFGGVQTLDARPREDGYGSE